MTVALTAQQFGQIVRHRRRALAMTQRDLALAAGVGERFIVDLERGKEGCELGRTLRVVRRLGLALRVEAPDVEPQPNADRATSGYDLDDEAPAS